jgi:predicted phosphodiesterase
MAAVARVCALYNVSAPRPLGEIPPVRRSLPKSQLASRARRYGSRVTAARVILVSDTHLSPAAPEAQANWEAVLGYVAGSDPDVVIHLGDLTLDGAHDPGHLAHGRQQLDRLPVPWHAVPGNHDIGDNPWPGAQPGSTVDTGRRQRWLESVGPDQWSLTADGWMLLGMNAQLLGSGLEAETTQWSWLEDTLSQHRDDQRIALITHKPVTAADAEIAAAPVYRFWPESAWRRLRGMLAGWSPVLVISGHVHQFRMLGIDGADHLWVPTTWAVLPDRAQPVLGLKRCGIVSLTLSSDAPKRALLVEPEGMTQLTLTENLPDPYHG